MDPVSSVSDAIAAVATLITKALPSDEERLEKLKANYPRLYARVKQHIIRQAYRYVKHHKGLDLDAYIDMIGTDDADKADLRKILKSIQ